MATATEPERPSLDRLYSVTPEGARRGLQPADVSGRYQRRKRVIWALLVAIYIVVPWLEIGGHPAVLIDIERRHFFLFGQTFTAQDFYLAFFFVTGLGFTLFVVSALWGRVWCGYACPQTVFLEGVFRRVERWLEGSARMRRALDRSPWNARKLVRRGSKIAIYLAVSLVLSHTFLSYFMPVGQVFEAITSPPTEHFTAFLFVAIFTAIIFFNFTWFREQLCIVICPYGRLQGVLYDAHTVNVGYDSRRGEPRGKKGTTDGDCVDCFRCVDVCPTGIDIRNGTQLECVGCANCIDACDDVMQRLGRPQGLVRYDTQAGFEGQPKRFLRPRLALYGVLLVIGTVVFAVAAGGRTPFEANLLRPQRAPYTIDGGMISNQVMLHLVNKLPRKATFDITVKPLKGAEVTVPIKQVELDSLTDRRLPIIVQFPEKSYRPETLLRVEVTTGDLKREATIPILGPR